MDITIESINYDYLPGQPEARRCWFITLRQPPNIRIFKIGSIMQIKGIDFNSLETWPCNINTVRIVDISGRNIEIEPSNYKINSINYGNYNISFSPPSFPNLPQNYNDRKGNAYFPFRPASFPNHLVNKNANSYF